MSAGDMADFMGDHALHFIGGIGRVDQPAVDIDDLPARHEGVDRRVVDQDDLNVPRSQPCRLRQRFRHFLQQRLGFRVTQDGLRGGRLGHQRHGGQQCNQAGEQAHVRSLSVSWPEPELKDWPRRPLLSQMQPPSLRTARLRARRVHFSATDWPSRGAVRCDPSPENRPW